MLDKTLLILDDDPLLGQTIQRLAQHIGITAQFCQTPDVFFELLESWQPDFLAIDLIWMAIYALGGRSIMRWCCKMPGCGLRS